MNADFHNYSFTVRFRKKFSIDIYRLLPRLSCVATLPRKIWNPIYSCFKNDPSHNFLFHPLCGRRTIRIWTPWNTRCGAFYKSVCTSTAGSRAWKSCASMSRRNLTVWTRKWLTTRSVNGAGDCASDWQPALQPAEDILNIHSEHYCICSHTD